MKLIDEQATVAVGRALGELLTAGDLVILDGPLGAGKTTLARGVGQGMGVAGPITSPTFVIARVHPPSGAANTPLVHVDAYRVGSVDDLESLDLDASLEDCATLVEWGRGRVETLSDSYLTLSLVRANGPVDDSDAGLADTRTLGWSVVGHAWDSRLARLRDVLGPQRN